MEAQQTPVRTAIMRIMSDMLDNPDKHGIYETGRFMDRIEQLLCDMMAAPEVGQLSGSEAVFGLIAWLTTRNETTVLGPHQVVDVEIITRFIETNNLSEPRKAWHELLVHPPELGPVDTASTDDSPEPEFGFVDADLDIDISVRVSGGDKSDFEEIEKFNPLSDDVSDASVSDRTKTSVGEALVEVTLEEVLAFIVKNGIHKKPK